MSSSDERTLRRYRALADPSRARILAELEDTGQLDARQLAERVGLHVNTVRVHLNVLAEAGLVESETLRTRARGRPRIAYRPTIDVGDEGSRRYRLLAEILTELVARCGPGAAELEDVGEAWGRYFAEAPPAAKLSDDEAVAKLIELLARVGFEPQLARDGQGQKIMMRRCPFLELARSHQEIICPIHNGLMRGALAELGAATRATALEPFVRPDLCVARLAAGTAA